MSEPDATQPEPPSLRLLRRLVTVLTAVMILGMVTVATVMVLRLPAQVTASEMLPETVRLPEGLAATAVTVGPGWYAVVTDTDEILIYDRSDGTLRKRVAITTAP